MANSRSSGINYEYATVDTKPNADGYWTKPISIGYLVKDRRITGVNFSVRETEADSSAASETSNITVSLQFKCPGDAGWQNYKTQSGNTVDVGNRILIRDTGRDVFWRAGVKDNDYVSGSLVFGFDW